MQKMLLPLLALLLLVGEVFPKECEIYKCESLNPSYTSANNFTCGKYSTTTPHQVSFQSCPSSTQFCPMSIPDPTKNTTAICKTDYVINLPPGAPCKVNSDCYSKNCTKNTCIATASLNQPCNHTVDCELGQYCNRTDQICKKVSLLGETCQQYCEAFAVCVHGHCVKKLSIPVGGIVDSLDLHSACVTAYAAQSAGKVICQHAPLLEGYDVRKPLRVMDGEICRYKTYNGEEKLETALCGYSKTSNAFCVPGLGDFVNNLKIVAQYVDLQPQCHLSAGFLCASAGIKHELPWLRAVQANAIIMAYPQLIETPECMKDLVGVADYFIFSQKLSEIDSALNIHFSYILVALFLILI